MWNISVRAQNKTEAEVIARRERLTTEEDYTELDSKVERVTKYVD